MLDSPQPTKIIMRCKQFSIAVEQNKGKELNLTNDKQKILNSMVPLDQVTMIINFSFGHKGLALYDTHVTIMEIISVDNDEENIDELA